MDKRIFNKYMNEQIIQKIGILGECFSINIDEWHPAKENSKYPHRIYFYQENNIVGYIDANTRN